MPPLKGSAPSRASLEKYNAKRDFRLTKEPAGALPRGSGKSLAFVIQKHAASHLHFDLRLECDGVMKSWAVPKGPSVDASVKRLAMEVEDHPVAYNKFEGTIPEGEYGGGTVMLWDRGTYTPDEVRAGESNNDAVRHALNAGKLAFTFHGERLHGSFALVRTRRGAERAQWLLIKHHDEFATEGRDIVAEVMTSVTTGRTMVQIAAGDNGALKSAEGADGVGAIDAMLPTPLTRALPEGEYAVEPAIHGVRAMAFVTNGTVQLISANGNSEHKKRTVPLDDYPDVQSALLRLARHITGALVLDGILCDGAFIVVDLLLRDAQLLVEEPWIERRRQLEDALVNTAPKTQSHLQSVRMNPWVACSSNDIDDAAAELHTADVIVKRIDSPYESGPSKLWIRIRADSDGGKL
jgi:bifunctional non-homologous end joining protein LigD